MLVRECSRMFLNIPHHYHHRHHHNHQHHHREFKRFTNLPNINITSYNDDESPWMYYCYSALTAVQCTHCTHCTHCTQSSYCTKCIWPCSVWVIPPPTASSLPKMEYFGVLRLWNILNEIKYFSFIKDLWLQNNSFLISCP